MAKSVLIVDDSAMIRNQVKRALVDAGFDTVEAVDGHDAFEKLSPSIDFVICDVNMPRMNGLEFLQKLEAEGRKAPPIMMLTTEAQPELVRDARQLGAVGWMVKPCEPHLLVQAVEKMAN